MEVILWICVRWKNLMQRRMFKGMYFEFETSSPWNCFPLEYFVMFVAKSLWLVWRSLQEDHCIDYGKWQELGILTFTIRIGIVKWESLKSCSIDIHFTKWWPHVNIVCILRVWHSYCLEKHSMHAWSMASLLFQFEYQVD